MNNGVESTWSPVWTFITIPSVPEVPVLNSPADNSGDIGLDTTLLWGKVNLATEYHIQVSDVSDFSVTLVDQTVTDTVYIFNGELVNNRRYFWRVCSVNRGGESEWSVVWSFTTLTATEVNKISIFQSIKVFPNPSNGIIQVIINSGLTKKNVILEIYDGAGKCMDCTPVIKNDVYIFNMENFSPGLYYLRVAGEGEEKIKKIIKR